MKCTKAKGIEAVIYEPYLIDKDFFHSRVVLDLDEFKQVCNVIIANRNSLTSSDLQAKVYTRVFFCSDSL